MNENQSIRKEQFCRVFTTAESTADEGKNCARAGAVFVFVAPLVSATAALAATNTLTTTTVSSGSSPNLPIGGGGGTTYDYSSTSATTPYGNHACWESSYEMARYGPINFCSTGGGNLVFDITAAFCAVSAYLAVENAFNGEFTTNGNSVVGYMSCLETVIQFLSRVQFRQLRQAGRRRLLGLRRLNHMNDNR